MSAVASFTLLMVGLHTGDRLYKKAFTLSDENRSFIVASATGLLVNLIHTRCDTARDNDACATTAWSSTSGLLAVCWWIELNTCPLVRRCFYWSIRFTERQEPAPNYTIAHASWPKGKLHKGDSPSIGPPLPLCRASPCQLRDRKDGQATDQPLSTTTVAI